MTVETTPQTHRVSLCERIDHPNGIIELVLKRVSTATVDAWYAHLDDIFSAAQPGETVRVLVETSVGMMPLTYAANRGRSFLEKHRAALETVKFRSVYLYKQAMIASLVGNMQSLLMRRFSHQLQSRFIPAEKREQAVAWLLLD